MPYTKVKYLPKKSSTYAWVETYGDTWVIARKHETSMFIIKFVAESFKTYFDILWKVSLDKI